MKKKTMLIIGGIVMIIFIAIASYLWYLYFLDLGTDGKYGRVKKDNSGIVLMDENKIYAVFSSATDYNPSAPGYKFKVINNSVSSADYKLKIVEIKPSQINDGCSEATLLKDSELNYTLLLNGQVLKEGTLGDLNKVLDTNTITIDSTNSYELKMWINDSAKDFNGNHYHYKVEIEVNK